MVADILFAAAKRVDPIREKKFYDYALYNIRSSMDHHDWMKNITYIVSTLVALLTLYFWQTRSLSTFVTCLIFSQCVILGRRRAERHRILRRQWYNACLETLFASSQEDGFVSYLDKLPKDIKDSGSYKRIRRRHFELTCGIEQ